MNIFQATFLGIIQGLTEFLPVSSSGHLVLFQHILGITEAELLFDISVHVGTLVSIFIFFRKEIFAVAASILRFFNNFFKTGSFSSEKDDPDLKLAFLIVTGSVPTAIIGLMFHKIADKLFSSVIITGLMLITTGILLFLTRYAKNPFKEISLFSFRDSLIIGISQGLAVMPGLSRSGTTIATGVFLGLKHETAARYSFLLSIPAIFGATSLGFGDIPGNFAVPLKTYFVGAIASCITGYLALNILFHIVKKGRLHYFSPYCLLMGIISVISGL
jgi:undecaprenyl-diphosphatase